MDIPINAKVNCSDGSCGESTSVILRPTTQEVTHVVVKNDSFPDTEYLVPIDHVVESAPDRIQLNLSREELAKMPVFNKIEFVPSELAGFPGNTYMMWPFYAPAAAFITLENEQIPADTLAIRRGARVEAIDGHVGRVDEFLINPSDDQITHLVLREGHLWGKRDVTIPVSQIDHFTDDTVYLKLNKQDIEELPSIPVRHSWTEKG